MKRSTNELTTQAHALLDPPRPTLPRLPLERARKAPLAHHRLDKDPHFLAMMSHEIRTPMNSLLGMLELLSKTTLSQEQHNMLRVSQDSARTLARVADDMLSESKMGANRVAFESVATDMGRLMIDLVALLRADSRRRQLVIRHELDPALAPVLLTDPVRLRQILLNLASNALKFTRRGEIVLQVEAHDVIAKPADLLADSTVRANDENIAQKIIIRVIDSGRGMSADMLAHAWGPFAQGLNASADSQAGTGLGLTISRQLARRLGGELTIDSIPGRGTTACLTLELSRPTRVGVASPLAQGVRSNKFARERSKLGPIGAFSANFIRACSQRARAKGAEQGTHARIRNTHRARTVEDWPRHRAPHEVSLRVLVADDHPASRLVLHRQLAQLGHRAEVVENGALGLARLRQGRYDVLLTDYRMPEMDGYALVNAWRQLEAAGVLPMPVIGLSANPQGSAFAQMHAVTMDECLVKPITLAQLDASLKIVSTSSRSRWTAHVIDFARQLDDQPTTAAIDLDRLANSFGGTEALHHILQAFVVATLEDLAILRPFMGKADPTHGTCRKRIHRVVGGLQVLGNLVLADEGAALERRLTHCPNDPGLGHDEGGATCRLNCLTHRTDTLGSASDTLRALRCAIRQFCMKVTLHIDWLIRQLTPIFPYVRS